MSAQRQSAPLSPKAVKLCELCGTLNLEINKECWTCRWSGSFSRESKTIAFAWRRLETLYEEVRVEHVTARHTRPIGDFGALRPQTGPRRLTRRVAACWKRFLDARDLRMAQRQAQLRSRMPSPPDQLSI